MEQFPINHCSFLHNTGERSLHTSDKGLAVFMYVIQKRQSSVITGSGSISFCSDVAELRQSSAHSLTAHVEHSHIV